jgi:hypothetical protein
VSLSLEKIKEEALALVPPTIFFFVALHVIALVRALMTRGTGLPVTSSAQIALAALIIGKAVLLADLWPPINRFPQRPLIYNVAWKTVIYYVAASLIHYLERLFDFSREAGGVVAGNRRLLAEMIWPHFLAIQIILLSIIFAYCVIRELGHALGEDKVFSMFFREPRAVGTFRRNGPSP